MTKNCFACFEEVEEKERLLLPCAHIICLSCVRAGLGASISPEGHALTCGLCRLPLTACIPRDMMANSYLQASPIHRQKLRAWYNTSQKEIRELLLSNGVVATDSMMATTPFPFPSFHDDLWWYNASASASSSLGYALRSLSHPPLAQRSSVTRRFVIPECYRLVAPRAISKREAMALKKARYRAIRVRLKKDYQQN